MELTAVALVIMFMATMWSSVERKLDKMSRRTAQLTRKVDLILEHLGIEEPQPELAPVRALILEGKKIHAIKAYREITGADLKEAKEAVDHMA
ncbi:MULTISPECIES: ribosomal protein L7/L12 [unclassified Streptomyces]|uniref:ribosomal protein L7/L12 n=1 Tax=unclassified Streptomyces TaxID=2593676 RepID=UPI003369F601